MGCLTVDAPQVQYAAGLVRFVHRQWGLPIASTAPWAPITHQHLAGFTAQEGVLFIGRAQEKTVVFQTEKHRNAKGGCEISREFPWGSQPVWDGLDQAPSGS